MKPPMLPTETAETMETEFDFNLATQTRDVIWHALVEAKRPVRAILDPVSHSIRAKFASSQGRTFDPVS